MTQMKKGLILPDTKDLLQYYLIQAKEEGTYVSNADIADAILMAMHYTDAEDIAHRLLELINKD